MADIDKRGIVDDGTPDLHVAGVFSLGDGTSVGSISGVIPVIPGRVKELVNNVASSLMSVDMTKTVSPSHVLPDNSFACKLFFAAECTDLRSPQIRQGDINLAVAMSGSTFVTSQGTNASSAVTSGSLTITFNWTASGTTAILYVTGSSSLVTTDFEFHYFLLHATHNAYAWT